MIINTPSHGGQFTSRQRKTDAMRLHSDDYTIAIVPSATSVSFAGSHTCTRDTSGDSSDLWQPCSCKQPASGVSIFTRRHVTMRWYVTRDTAPVCTRRCSLIGTAFVKGAVCNLLSIHNVPSNKVRHSHLAHAVPVNVGEINVLEHVVRATPGPCGDNTHVTYL